MSSRLFLGQASNYRAKDVVRHTFAIASSKWSNMLKSELAERYDVPDSQVHLMNNGRSALAAALKILVPKNSEVIINAFTCYAVLQAVEHAGCKVIYADINKKTLSFDTKTLATCLKKHPHARAIVLQNTLGIPMDIVALEKFAKEHQLVIIEDLAHATGIKYADGREIGSVGAAAALSFGKGKSLDAITGGALILREQNAILPKLGDKHPKLPDSLRARWYPLFATIGRSLSRVHLEKYWYGPLIKIHFIERAVDAKLDYRRRPTYWQDKLVLRQLESIPPSGATPIRTHLFVKNRAQLIEKLDQNGFNFREIWYDVPISPVRYYKKVHFPEKEFPVATAVSKEIINLPNYYQKSALAPALKIIKENQK